MLSIYSASIVAQAESAGKAASVPDWTGTFVVILLLVVGLFGFVYTTRAGIIARATTKEAVRQPVFLLLLGIGMLVLIINTVLPFFSLGEDVKMLKDCGLATILICGLLLAIWTSSTSIAAEIEGKTAMTLLSKPINRRQFIIGKFVGIVQALLLLLIPLSLCLLLLIYYKVGYDAIESAKGALPAFDWREISWLPFSVPWPIPERVETMLQIMPALVLILLETMVLTAISVAISTRLPMVVNMITCFTIFVIGHLTPVLVQADAEDGRLEFVQFMAQLIATVLPSLEAFNMQAAVATGSIVPPEYLGFAALFCLVYCAAAILLAFVLFEDRDLA